MQIFDTANLLSTMLPAFFSFALPIIIFVILVNLITKFIRRKMRQKTYVKFNQRNIANTLNANFYWGRSLRLWKKSTDKRRCILWFYIPNAKKDFKIWCEFKFIEKRGERPCDYFKVWMYSATVFASSSLIGVAIGFIIAPRPNLFAPVL